MKITMNLDTALRVHKDIVDGFARWGKQFSAPYSQTELYEAIVVLAREGNIGGPSSEEVTRLRRQLAACMNREKARNHRIESIMPVDEDVAPAPRNE